MVQCNIDIEEDTMDHASDADVKHGFHLNPMSQDRESDTGSMMSKYKIDLMFTINKKDVKGKDILGDKGEDVQIENKVQEKIDQMFKEVALNDMMRNFFVDYLGSIQLNSDKVQSLETLQDPLKKLYISYKKEKQMKVANKKSVLEITKNGLKLSYGNKLEQMNSFSTICVWASVKLITRPHGVNKEFGLEYCFVPLVADYKNNNIKFIKLNQNESYLFPKNTYHDNIPIFVVVMKKMCATKILEAHAFICNSNEEAINIAANLYKTLLLTTNKNKSKIRQKNGITSCMSVNDSLKGSLSKVSHVVSNGISSRDSIRNFDVKSNSKDEESRKQSRVESVINEIENRTKCENTCHQDHQNKDSRGDRRKVSDSRDRRSSSVESVKDYKVDVARKKEKPEGNLGQKSGSVESVRQYVDYVSEAVKHMRRRSSVISSRRSSRQHRSSSVESVKDYEVKSQRTKHGHLNVSRYNSTDSMNMGVVDKTNRATPSKKYSRGSTESLRRNLRANSVESILSYNQIHEPGPDLPYPKRKHSNFSMVSCNGVIETQGTDRTPQQRRNSCDNMLNGLQKSSSNSEFYPNDNAGVFRSRRTSTNAQNSNRSRNSSMNYLNISSTSVNSMTEFDTRDLNLPKRLSRNSQDRRRSNDLSQRKDSFTNETLGPKARNKSQKNFDDIEIYNDMNKENKNGDILTRVAIPRSTSFLKTDSSSRNSLNYTVKSHGHPVETRKTSSSKLGLNEIFQELRNQEGLNNLDEILDVILNPEGMSFNNLKPIYKEFIVKLALILTKDEFYDKCKIIMNKQKKRKKKMKRKKVLNRFINSEINSLLSCGKKKLLRKTSIYKNTLMKKRRPLAKKRKSSQKIFRPKDDKNMLLNNDMNTSSGYFTYSECTYDTDSCTCISADKCYCNNHSSRGLSMSPALTMLPHKHNLLRPDRTPNGKTYNTMSSTFPNCSTFQSRYNEDQHCYHCFRYKTSRPREDNGLICECDTESCTASDKCYCNMTNINMIDMLKLQGFAASDTSIDSFRTDYPTAHNWKANLLKKPKDKHYIQASKSLEFVQFYGVGAERGFNTMDSQQDPSSSSFSYKDIGDSSESSALDYNLFHKAKEKCDPTTRSGGDQNKFLVVSARDPKGRIIYMGADKKHLSRHDNGHTDAISIKKSAEIAALFMKKQNQSSGFNEIGYHDLSSGISRRNILETSLGYLP
ncbi:uncharacterized protein LOC103515981 [Diaphorina citri]|uniref:Uncharacterized protein LOC103515981 n=1 Tax=Diaphorina citri TaxID=121845 RepID=A0A3Q0JAV8_DIACI|nr:uncharacterized protein LOC103515981 [Diaphorina citri]KAI5724398.1 hypothetical protein M8J77_002143 [Diaphorina citri]